MSKEPKYKIIESYGEIEIREYDSFLVAEIEVSGERQEALRAGFRILAAFIFGDNTAKTKIAMNIPVTQQKQDHYWKIRFMMPEEYTVKTLPEPNNQQIKIFTTEFQRVAVITFSGIPSDKKLKLHIQKLEKFCQKYKLVKSESPVFAFYNPPWTLPFLRRNEVMYLLNG